MRIVNWNELAEDQRRQLLTRPAMAGAADITSTVSDIINRIRREGDKALKEYTAAFDRVADGNILLSQEAIAAACERVSVAMKAARSAPRSDPAKSHDFLPSAKPRNARSAALFVRQILPSSRNDVNPSQRLSM